MNRRTFTRAQTDRDIAVALAYIGAAFVLVVGAIFVWGIA